MGHAARNRVIKLGQAVVTGKVRQEQLSLQVRTSFMEEFKTTNGRVWIYVRNGLGRKAICVNLKRPVVTLMIMKINQTEARRTIEVERNRPGKLYVRGGCRRSAVG